MWTHERSEVVQRTPFARTIDSLRADWAGPPRRAPLVHIVERAGLITAALLPSSTRCRGPGSQAIGDARAFGRQPDLSAGNTYVPREWWPTIARRAGLRPAPAPTRGLGRIAELFELGRVVRARIQLSFRALGPMAKPSRQTSLDFGLGRIATGRLYEHGGRVTRRIRQQHFHLAVPCPESTPCRGRQSAKERNMSGGRGEVEPNSDVFAERSLRAHKPRAPQPSALLRRVSLCGGGDHVEWLRNDTRVTKHTATTALTLSPLPGWVVVGGASPPVHKKKLPSP
jgi:hypothetical protein